MTVRYIKKENLYIFLFVFFMLSAALTSVLTYLMIVVLAIGFIYINFNKRKSDSIIIPKIALALLVFQNFSIGVGAHVGGNFNSELSWITQVPTLFIVISYATIIFSKKMRKEEIYFYVYVIFCTCFLFVGDGALVAKITYLRNFVIFYMAFIIGKYYLNTDAKIEEYVEFFLKLSIIAVIFGIIGLLLGKSFYHSMGVLEVYKAKQYTAYRDGLPGNFMTVFLGRWVNRLASLYYDPVNFSYFMALSCLIAFVCKRKMLLIIFFVCEILTFGKGGLLICGLTMTCLITQTLFKRYNAKFIRTLILSGAVISVMCLVYIIQTQFADDFGTYNHFYGMTTGFKAVKENPLGHGLGTAGNLIKTVERNHQEISETGLINMAYQIGIIGTVMFSYIFLLTAKGAFRQYNFSKNRFSLMCSFLPLVLLIVSVYQENTYTPQCIVPYMLFIGCAWNYQCKKVK